ncbi:hypothetical protein JCM18750_01880 [Halostagnicola bangensis]
MSEDKSIAMRLRKRLENAPCFFSDAEVVAEKGENERRCITASSIRYALRCGIDLRRINPEIQSQEGVHTWIRP